MKTYLLSGMAAALLLFDAAVPVDVAADAAIRPDGLVFNQAIPLAAGRVGAMPLYLTRRGEYYAQAVLEAADGGERTASVQFDLDIEIARREDVVFSRSLATELGRERPVATLFWITSDRELPLKTPLGLAINMNNVQSAASGDMLRIQIRRKKNFGLRAR